MKFFYNLFFLFFISLNISSQNFEFYKNKAKEDYENQVIGSPYYDKALETCPDIEKHPKLLMYKGIDLFFLNKPVIAIKYLELAKLYIKNDADNILLTNNLALIYSEVGNYEKGNTYFKETLKKAIETGDAYFEEEVRFNMLLNDYELIVPSPPITKFWEFYNNLDKKSKAKNFEYLNIFFELNNDRSSNKEAEELRSYIYKNFVIDSFENNVKSMFYQNNATLKYNLKEYDTALNYNDSAYVIAKHFLGTEEILDGLYTYKEIYEGKRELEVALKYVDSIKIIEDEVRKEIQNISTEIVDENILFNKTKLNTENKIKDYKSFIIVIIVIAAILLIFYFIRRKKQKENLVKLNTELLINKGKYNKSLKENIEFKRKIKILLKEKKFDEISKLHKTHEIEDLNNDTYIEYLASEIEPTFLNRLEKHTFTFTDIEKIVLYYRKNNHTYQEIAIVTNRTLRSIQSLSYRLNKKILAKKNQDLANFLENL